MTLVVGSIDRLFSVRILVPFIDVRHCYYVVIEKPQGSWIPNAHLPAKGRHDVIVS